MKPISREAEMSQWGATRTRTWAGSMVRVIAHVETRSFNPIGTGSIVESLHCLDRSGPDAFRLLQELSDEFVGKPYSLFRDAPP
jgi:hypothetical protein